MPFYNKGVTEVSKTFMTKMEKHFRHQNLTIGGQAAQALEMPYVDDSLSMVIVLPEARDGLSRMLASNSLTSDLGSALAGFSNSMERSEMNLYIPKFKIESDYALVTSLTQLGIRKAFTEGQADLSGINGETNLFVSQVKHKAVVKVDEKGTEAAAVTMVDVYPMSARYPYVPPIDFRADHPFLFFIRDRVSGLILFTGKLEEL